MRTGLGVCAGRLALAERHLAGAVRRVTLDALLRRRVAGVHVLRGRWWRRGVAQRFALVQREAVAGLRLLALERRVVADVADVARERGVAAGTDERRGAVDAVEASALRSFAAVLVCYVDAAPAAVLVVEAVGAGVAVLAAVVSASKLVLFAAQEHGGTAKGEVAVDVQALRECENDLLGGRHSRHQGGRDRSTRSSHGSGHKGCLGTVATGLVADRLDRLTSARTGDDVDPHLQVVGVRDVERLAHNGGDGAAALDPADEDDGRFVDLQIKLTGDVVVADLNTTVQATSDARRRPGHWLDLANLLALRECLSLDTGWQLHALLQERVTHVRRVGELAVLLAGSLRFPVAGRRWDALASGKVAAVKRLRCRRWSRRGAAGVARGLGARCHAGSVGAVVRRQV